MKRTSQYTQCTLRNGERQQVAYIPSHLATVGRFLKVHGINGWEVIGVFQSDAAATVEAHQMDYRKQRRASDI